jgi:signal transduction histidine kinase
MVKGITGLLLAFGMTVIAVAGYAGNSKIDASVDSIRNELRTKTGIAKIKTQLDLANRLQNRDKNEAINLANSALAMAKQTQEEELVLTAYLALGKFHETIDKRDLASSYYDSALVVSAKLKENWFKGEVLFRKGVIEHHRGDEILALNYFNESLQACRLSQNYKIMGSSYSMMGTVFRVNGLYDRAIEYIINSRINYEKADSKDGDAWASYVLGRIYFDLKLPEKALFYFQQALKLYEQLAAIDGNKEGLAICYEQLGLLYLDSGNFREAKSYVEKTLAIYTEKKSNYGISNTHKNLGIIEFSLGNFRLAEKYLNEALNVNRDVGDILNLPTIYQYLGLCSIGQGKKQEGITYLEKGLELALTNNQKKVQLTIYSKLAEVYLNAGDFKNAILCQKKQIEIQDLMLSGGASIKIEQLQAIYEIDKKNSQIVELEKQNEINSLKIKQHQTWQLLMVAGTLIAFAFSIVIYWFNTKIRQKNTELKTSNGAKDKLFAIIAHDLRGPIGTLTFFLENINETIDDISKDELKTILSELAKSSENVNVLINNLLIWARSQLNKIEYRPLSLNLSELIQNSLKGLAQTAEDKQIEIQLELNRAINVWADQNMVQTVIRNLISNAIKFTPRGGQIAVKARIETGNCARISVIDNGVGINQSALPGIFDISNSFHTPGTENEQSSGLGLILVKDFVEKNKGKVIIESEEGKGTTVSFTLPVV